MMKQVAITAILLLIGQPASASDAGFLAATKILIDGMNASADPCNDFYNYACGNWPAKHNTKDDYDPLTIMYVKILDVLGDALMKLDPVANDNVRFPFDQAGLVYYACMHGGRMPSEGQYNDLEYMAAYLDDLGGWPSINPNYLKHVPGGAVGISGYMTGLANISPFFQAQVSENYLDPTKNTLLLQGQNAPTDALGQPVVIDVDKYAKFYLTLVQLLWNAGSKKGKNPKVEMDMTQAEKDAAQIALLYAEAVNSTWAAQNWTVATTTQQYFQSLSTYFNPYTITSAIQRWPHINWPQYLLNVAQENTDLVNMFGTDFYIAFPSYMDTMDQMFANEEDRTMRNFAFFQFALALTPGHPSLRKLWREAGLELGKDRRVKDRPSDAGICAEQIMGTLPSLMGRIYADHSSLTRSDIDELNEMIGLVLASWRGMITDVTWMSQPSKMNAFAKIDMVARNVAWPQWIMNDAALADHLKTLNVTVEDDAFTAMIKSARWAAWQQFSSLNTPVDRYAFGQSPAVVNAWYSPWVNSITFPGAIMTAPMFNGSYPKTFNYGHIGWVMGHELGHGFDNNGVYFGPLGAYINSSWIDPQSKKGFDTMAQCVVDEYNQYCFNFTDGRICINGEQTLPENIADNGGILASYRAVSALLALSGGEPPMPPGYEPVSSMTTDQLFFLSAASTWCSNYPESLIRELIETDVHSPDQFRVIGTLRNLPQFATAFKCKVGVDYMAPAQHCHVWTK